MKANRRNFIKKAAFGSAALSAGLRLNTLNAASETEPGLQNVVQNAPAWDIVFNEQVSELSLKNGTVTIQGRLSFSSGKNNWSPARSRDGIPGRFTLVDSQDNVQGYFVFSGNNGQLRLFFYHRSAQSFEGVLTFEGKVSFLPESFVCRTRPKARERVLSLVYGPADSLLSDSIFDTESDTILRFDASHLKMETLAPGSFSIVMSGSINESSEAELNITLEKDYFRKRYVPYYHPLDRTRCPEAPSGWMSWNTYFDTATADDNLAEARIGQKYLQPFGCKFWHIESWQGNSDKLPVRDFYNLNLEVSERKFPEGMKKLADDIRKLGFRPGLWTAPFGTGNKEFYDAHKDWFLHDKDGQPLSTWNGRYTLDPTIMEARDHIRNIHHIASQEWGYEYFKVDGMSGRNQGYCAHFYERPDVRACFRNPSCRNPFDLVIKAIREGIGEDRIFLACQGHTTGPEVLYADAARIGADIVSPNKPVQWTGVYHQGSCTANQVFTHNIVMIGDPDTLLVRDLPLEEARVSATVVALPGQLTFFGDKLAGLPQDRMKILQQTLPPVNIRPFSLYPYFSMMPVWNLKVNNGLLGNYNVVAVFNWDDEDNKIPFTTVELGIDTESEYLVYEFWTQKNIGTVVKDLSIDVPAHGVRLLVIHNKKSIPQWVSSDRHITQNGMELSEYKWKNENKTIEGRIHLTGTFPLTMRMHVPEGFSFDAVECEGAQSSSFPEKDNMLALTFSAKKTGDYQFRIKF